MKSSDMKIVLSKDKNMIETYYENVKRVWKNESSKLFLKKNEMEIEGEESFQREVSKTIQSYCNLLVSNISTKEVIYEEFAELFSCDVYIKNGLISKVIEKKLKRNLYFK